jgi:hypothetical protein
VGDAVSWRKAGLLRGLLAGLALSLFLSGCATYSDSFGAIQGDLAAGNYDFALKEIEKQSRSKTDHVLYLLNKGMVLRMKRDFAGSNQALEAAKGEMERLYAASVSQNAMSFLINDATVSYGGEDYEQVLVHLYMALNYLELGQKDEARVEAQQVDIKLREIAAKVSGNRYARDAFVLYLTGMIYEDLGERSDAMISYRDAYKAYGKYRASYGTPMPDELKRDLLRMAVQLGLKDEAAQYSKEFNIPLASPGDAPPKEQEGELVFIFNNGLAPIKREKRSAMVAPPPSTLTGGSNFDTPGVYVTIALPYYESRPNNVASARVSVLDKQASTERVENLDAIARASLDSHMGAIIARSMARAVVKAKVQEAVDRAGQRNNDSGAALLGSILVRVGSVATERADTRSWLTLPAEIQLAHLSLPPGQYTIKVEMLDAGGQTVATREFPGIVITGAHKTYLTEHWTPPVMHSTARR